MATLKTLDDMLNNPASKTSPPQPHPATKHSTPSTALDWSLQRITTAAARYHRAGPTFKSKSEAFWIFTAASCTRSQYEEEIERTIEKLPKTKSVEEDLSAAKRLVREAIEAFKKAETRDAKVLEEAWREFEMVERW